MSASKNTPSLSRENRSELQEIANLLRVLAFAVEAERVLADMESMAMLKPQFGELLRANIDGWSQWVEYSGGTAEVLSDVQRRVLAMLGEEG